MRQKSTGIACFVRRAVPALVMLAFVLLACQALGPAGDATLVPTTLVPPTPTATTEAGPPAPHQPPTLTAPPVVDVTMEPFACDNQPHIGALLNETTPETWIDWIEKLSGAEPVIVDGQETTITTRFTMAMFGGSPNARAFDYVHQQVLEWYPEQQVKVMDFEAVAKRDKQEFPFKGKNLILTLPGISQADETVILSAHLDSITSDPMVSAPGAEDNASGSAALLEAARLFRGRQFERTVQIIWFTGEELGLHGSRNFVERLSDPQKVVGVVNLDMFGYDSDSDRCFEMHVGTLLQSDRVGQCFTQVISAYNLDLPRYDYLEGEATSRSDHGSFWTRGIGAIEILENMFDNSQDLQDQPNACTNGDVNPYYHTENDIVENINPQSGIQIVRAAMAAVAAMAGLLP